MKKWPPQGIRIHLPMYTNPLWWPFAFERCKYYYDVWAYRENDGIPATAQALRDASLSLAGRKLSVAMLNDGNGTRCAGVFTIGTRAETWLEKSMQVDADAYTWVETKHANRPEKDV